MKGTQRPSFDVTKFCPKMRKNDIFWKNPLPDVTKFCVFWSRNKKVSNPSTLDHLFFSEITCYISHNIIFKPKIRKNIFWDLKKSSSSGGGGGKLRGSIKEGEVVNEGAVLGGSTVSSSFQRQLVRQVQPVVRRWRAAFRHLLKQRALPSSSWPVTSWQNLYCQHVYGRFINISILN